MSFFLFCLLASLSFVFSVFQCTAAVSGLLACVCCTCRIQYDGMALHCLLPFSFLYYTMYQVVSLCRSFVTTELASLWDEESQHGYGVCWMSAIHHIATVRIKRYVFVLCFSSYPICYLCITWYYVPHSKRYVQQSTHTYIHYFLQLPLFRSSDPGSHSRHSSP